MVERRKLSDAELGERVAVVENRIGTIDEEVDRIRAKLHQVSNDAQIGVIGFPRVREDVERIREGLDSDRRESKILRDSGFRRLDHLEWNQKDILRRLDTQEAVMSKLSDSCDSLTVAVNQYSKPAAQQVKEAWRGAQRRTRLKLVGGLVAVVCAPEAIKSLVEVFTRLLAHVR